MCPVRQGTANMVLAAAMSEAELGQCLRQGAAVVDQFAAQADIVSLGEMGIGNTTSAAAIIAALFGWPPVEVVGAGTGADTAMQAHKAAVIGRALSLHQLSPTKPLEIMRCVGGLEIGMMAGAYLRAAALGKVVLVDGFIATSAWAVAHALQPALRDYSIFGHLSGEQAHARVLDALQVEPLLRLAAAFFTEMASFADAGID